MYRLAIEQAEKRADDNSESGRCRSMRCKQS